MSDEFRYLRSSDLTPAHLSGVPRLFRDWTNRAGISALLLTGALSNYETPGDSFANMFNAASGYVIVKFVTTLYAQTLKIPDPKNFTLFGVPSSFIRTKETEYIDTNPDIKQGVNIYLPCSIGLYAILALAVHDTIPSLYARDYEGISMGLVMSAFLANQTHACYKIGTGQWNLTEDPPPPPKKRSFSLSKLLNGFTKRIPQTVPQRMPARHEKAPMVACVDCE